MAENKKSFVLYADLLKSIEHLTNEEKGILFNHLLEYVNDKNPILTDRLLLTAWKPIEVQLKRDLQRWDEKIDKRSDAGMKSAGKKSFEKWLQEALIKGIDKISSDEHLFEAGRCYKYMIENQGTYMYYHYQYANEYHQQMSTKSTCVESVQQTSTKSTVSVSVNDNVNVTVIKKENNIEERKLKFASTLEPFLNVYGKNLLTDFYKYWTEPNKSNSKFKQELEKTWSLERRLETWAKNDKNFSKEKSYGNKESEITLAGRQTIDTVQQNLSTIGLVNPHAQNNG